MKITSQHFVLIAFSVGLILLTSCENATVDNTTFELKPRPIEVQLLTNTAPPSSSFVSAPVASWKTERIGMEITGRIEQVVEPNSDIEGRVRDEDGNVIIVGTPIARIENERYVLQVQSAKAQVARAEQAIEAAKIQLENTLPAQIKAAEAEVKRAQTEFDRSKRLVDQNAGAQADVDRDEAGLSQAISQVEQLRANVNSQKAEIQSLDAQLLQAKDSLRDAERNLEDCTLYSSFRGQIANVAVVPGSVVSAGQEVATIQMMDPIKVEVEVSAEDSRRLRNRQRLPVLVTREDGSIEEQDGFLYLVDPTADSQTRTFTLTLLMMNKKIVGDDEGQENLATIDQTWRLDFQFLPGAKEGKLYVAQAAILQDDQGPFVWRINNLKIHGQLPADRKLEVNKLRLKLGESKVPFLGNWIFQEVEVLDDTFNPTTDMIAGKLSVNGDPNQWTGDTIVFQNTGQWMLRPGDLVKVDLSDTDSSTGIFVPMDAIAYDNEKTFLFIVDESSSPPIAHRVQVKLDQTKSDATSSLMRISPLDESVTLQGKKFVSVGAHFLRDGEPVLIVAGEARE